MFLTTYQNLSSKSGEVRFIYLQNLANLGLFFFSHEKNPFVQVGILFFKLKFGENLPIKEMMTQTHMFPTCSQHVLIVFSICSPKLFPNRPHTLSHILCPKFSSCKLYKAPKKNIITITVAPLLSFQHLLNEYLIFFFSPGVLSILSMCKKLN